MDLWICKQVRIGKETFFKNVDPCFLVDQTLPKLSSTWSCLEQ